MYKFKFNHTESVKMKLVLLKYQKFRISIKNTTDCFYSNVIEKIRCFRSNIDTKTLAYILN